MIFLFRKHPEFVTFEEGFDGLHLILVYADTRVLKPDDEVVRFDLLIHQDDLLGFIDDDFKLLLRGVDSNYFREWIDAEFGFLGHDDIDESSLLCKLNCIGHDVYEYLHESTLISANLESLTRLDNDVDIDTFHDAFL